MQYIEVIRKPFILEAIEITTDNIEELAALVGTLKHKEDGTPFIQLNRQVIPGPLYRAFPGFWLTKVNDNHRCYAPKVFHKEFGELDPNTRDWVNYLNGQPAEVAPVG